jgi:alkaline phosphatase D
VIPDSHCFEKWANFPHERERLLNELSKANGGQTVLVSGDRHLGEVSRIELDGVGALYEVTASGMNSAGAGKHEVNRFRVHDDNVRVDHFGLLRAEVGPEGVSIFLEIRDVEGDVIQTATTISAGTSM